MVNLSDDPEDGSRLASLLRKVHPISVQVQGTDEPYVLWSNKKALTASQYTTRLEELKTDHEFVLQLVQIHFWKMMDEGAKLCTSTVGKSWVRFATVGTVQTSGS